MKRTKPQYYWDTTIFLAWMKNETRPAGEMEGLAEIAAMIDRRGAVLITSVVTKTEVLQSSLDDRARALFDALFKRSNIVLCDITEAISDMASEIRDRCQNDGRKIKTPDAQHLATAIAYKVDEMHTFDEKLLKLDGNLTGHNLAIRKPQGNQREMFGS